GGGGGGEARGGGGDGAVAGGKARAGGGGGVPGPRRRGHHGRVTGPARGGAWLARPAPPVEQVCPDLWSVPVPIPDSPLRYTLTYLIAAGSGLVVVDPGWNSEAGWQALAEGLKAAGPLPADVTRVVVTHIHPDHHALSAPLRHA